MHADSFIHSGVFFSLVVQGVQCLLKYIQHIENFLIHMFRYELPEGYTHYWFSCLKKNFEVNLFVLVVANCLNL